MNNIIFSFQKDFFEETEKVINNFSDNKTVQNNCWSIIMYFYFNSNYFSKMKCKRKYLSSAQINEHCNGFNKTSLFKQFIKQLIENKLLYVNNNFSKNGKFSKQYGIHERFSYLICYSTELIDKEIKLSKKSYNSYFNTDEKYDDDENRTENINYYKDIEKEFFGFHKERNDIEKIMEWRLFNNFSIDKKRLKDHISLAKQKRHFDEIWNATKILKSINKKHYSYSHGRFYFSNFHFTPEELRDIFLYNDHNFIELLDIKSSFILFAVILYSINGGDKTEIDNLCKEITEEDIYDNIGRIAVFNYDQGRNKYRKIIKNAFCNFLFENKRGKQIVREGSYLYDVKQYLMKYPKFYNFISQFDEIEVTENGKKKKKSSLSVACEWVENKLFLNQLVSKFIKLPIITLHDAIYIDETEYSEKLRNEITAEWKKIINSYVIKIQTDEKWDAFMSSLEEIAI